MSRIYRTESGHRDYHAAAGPRPNRLTLEHRDLCYVWRDEGGWIRGMATVVSQVGQGRYWLTMTCLFLSEILSQNNASYVTARLR